MIVATVGTQLPFPRFLDAIDSIAGRHGLSVFAQTADPDWAPRHIQATPHLSPAEFARRAQEARLIAGHAGIGTLLTAKKLAKPLIIYPRRAALGEHRNEHQLATARALEEVKGCYIAWDDSTLETLLLRQDLEPASMESSERRTALIGYLREFVSRNRGQ